jgi:hypothetical protein
MKPGLNLTRNLALFGLIGGTLLLGFGMLQSSITLALCGVGTGVLVGLPAAYLWFFIYGQSPKLGFWRRDEQAAASDDAAEKKPAVIEEQAPAPSAEAKRTPPVKTELEKRHTASLFEEMLEKVPARPTTDTPPPAPPALSEEERQAMLERLQNSSADELDSLITASQHADTLVRLTAVQALARLDTAPARQALRQALQDEQDVVRRAARLALNNQP